VSENEEAPGGRHTLGMVERAYCQGADVDSIVRITEKTGNRGAVFSLFGFDHCGVDGFRSGDCSHGVELPVSNGFNQALLNVKQRRYSPTVRPEPVEGRFLAVLSTGLRQAQPERFHALGVGFTHER
jgi:hypothetical protein